MIRTERTDGHVVESWYDRHARQWVTAVKDPGGFTVGECECNGTRAGMRISHGAMVAAGGGTVPSDTSPADNVQALVAAAKAVLAHVEDMDLPRASSGQCTLCYTYRALLRTAVQRVDPTYEPEVQMSVDGQA